MRKKSILTYSGRLSTDTDPRYVKPENHIAAQNVYGTPKENGGTLFVAPGGVQVVTDLSSTHTLIGTFEEKTTNKIYYLVYVPASPDRIYVYDPLDQSAPNGVARELCRFTGLDLNTQYLAQGKIVGGKYLIWTESNMIKNTLEGNGIKKINLERADVNKRFTYKIAVTQVSEANEDHLYQLYDVNGTPISSAVFYSPTEPEDTIQDRINAIAIALDALPSITAVAYKNYVLVTMGTVGRRFAATSTATTTQSGLTDWPQALYNGQALLCWADNHYPLETTRQMFDLCKRPFPCAPYHEFQANPDPLDKFVDLSDGAWQFIVRLHFVDDEYSAWSEPSIIASNRLNTEQVFLFMAGIFGGEDIPNGSWEALIPQSTQNLIKLRYHSSLISDETFLSSVKSVELAVRSGDGNPYYQIEKIPIEDVIADKFEFTFRNDKLGDIVPSDDAFFDVETQVLKKFDWVPQNAGSIGLIAEESGNAKIVIGSPEEGYDNIDKADCSVSFTLTEDYYMDRKLQHRLKERGEYKLGIEYLDDFGRVSDVVHIADITIPSHENPSGMFKFQVNVPEISIRHQPPIWATRYRIVRTDNIKHREFFQYTTLRFGLGPQTQDMLIDWQYYRPKDNFEPGYVEIDPQAGETFDDATVILIKIPTDFSESEDITSFKQNPLNSWWFTPQKGDKLRVMRAMYFNGDFEGKWTQIMDRDLDIQGIYTNPDDGFQYMILDKFDEGTDGGNVIIGAYMIEVYRPKLTDDYVYKETGMCFNIINPGANNRYHSGNIQNQNNIDPALVEFIGGDIMWTGVLCHDIVNFTEIYNVLFLPAVLSQYYFNVERPYYSDRVNNATRSTGRGNLEDSLREEYVFNRFRHSQIYLPNSKINNLNSFRGADYIDINEEFGPIAGLEMSGNTLMAICFNKLQPIYINRQDILNVNNAGLLGTSNKAFPLASELRGDYGCQHKESILSQDGKIYGWDKRTGVIWRYDVNGINDIRIDMVNTFSEIGEYRKSHLINLDRVFTGFDRRRNIFFIYFQEINRDGITSCWMFNEDDNGWKGTLTMTPQMMNMVNDKLLSWKENQLYVHDGIGHIPANYHGVQTTPKVTKVFNPEPELIKIPWAATTQSGKLWSFPEITSPPSRHYATGQQSRIRSENWRNISGKWSAAFLRDMNDTKAEFLEIPNLTTRAKTALLRGRVLRDNHFIITLQMDIPDSDTLFATEIEYSVDKKE